MPSSTEKINRVFDGMEATLVERQGSGSARPEELMLAMMLPFARQALSEMSADDLDQGFASGLALVAQLFSDDAPSVLLVPGRGAFWAHVDPLDLADPEGCVHLDLEGPTIDGGLGAELARLSGGALSLPDPVRGDDRDR